MTITEMAKAFSLEVIQGEYEDKDIKAAYTSDLLSDVMGNADEESILITIQAHKNTIAVATLKDSPAIIICNNRPIPEDMISVAKEEGIAIFLTDKNQFEISGLLYNAISK